MMVGTGAPIYFRSITTTLIPFLARVQARYLPASPLPSTTTSYSSGCDMGVHRYKWIIDLGASSYEILDVPTFRAYKVLAVATSLVGNDSPRDYNFRPTSPEKKRSGGYADFVTGATICVDGGYAIR